MGDTTVWIPVLITAVGMFLASSGFWTYVQYKDSKKDARTKLLLGIGYYTIQEECIKHLHVGHITREEYNEIHMYLYEPYVALGGNGTAKKMMSDVGDLPLRHAPLRPIIKDPPDPKEL